MLLPDSLSQLEEFGRHKRPRKAHRGHSRPHLFSDLWVRIGDSTPPPQPNVRITKGYVTVEPALTHQEQRRRADLYPSMEAPSKASPSALPTPSSAQSNTGTTHALTYLLTLLITYLLFTS
ncbi:metalloprotease TIKI2-like [Salvelinus sp. IW2-2015]|uniref:metalloprotease TIKI2-like n=1 Tax=Salvelinus sp. IW2-2015 TaxID=2691554 RepID=UPI000CDF9A38|nr:metalloprotease TIKI2-like [Salvelinus alpinus]XP_023855136.1 metalloprotease TIKI2-like [Salvelinus alpinus]